MKVVRAEHAGACYGVQRALDLALVAAVDGERTSTLGPLIHNPQVVAELAKKGIRPVDGPEQAERGSVIIRSHGVAPAIVRSIEERGLTVIDATCPHVARAQKAAAELARRRDLVVVVGEAGHPEVEGLVACVREAGGAVAVAADPTDIPADLPASVGVVVQTTQTREVFDSVVAELVARGVDLEVKNTICFATRQRQDEAADLARHVDALVVIGGRNSSNTTRLADICAAVLPRTHHIETPDEIEPGWFEGCGLVGVTAGASTPESQIDAVVTRLESL